jgi:hypothetical protein
MTKGLFTFEFVKQCRSNYSLIPMVGVAGLGVSMFVMNIFRNLAKNPEIVVDKRHNPRPWEKLVDEGTYL